MPDRLAAVSISDIDQGHGRARQRMAVDHTGLNADASGLALTPEIIFAGEVEHLPLKRTAVGQGREQRTDQLHAGGEFAHVALRIRQGAALKRTLVLLEGLYSVDQIGDLALNDAAPDGRVETGFFDAVNDGADSLTCGGDVECGSGHDLKTLWKK